MLADFTHLSGPILVAVLPRSHQSLRENPGYLAACLPHRRGYCNELLFQDLRMVDAGLSAFGRGSSDQPGPLFEVLPCSPNRAERGTDRGSCADRRQARGPFGQAAAVVATCRGPGAPIAHLRGTPVGHQFSVSAVWRFDRACRTGGISLSGTPSMRPASVRRTARKVPSPFREGSFGSVPRRSMG